MADTAPTLSLSDTDAAQWNRDLLQKFQVAVEKNPAVDLLSLFPDSYRREHRNAQYRQLSYAASINLRTLYEVHDELQEEPEGNLLSMFPKNYIRRITMATGALPVPRAEPVHKNTAPDFRVRLAYAKTAKVVFPLSEKATALLAQYGESAADTEKTLIASLRQLLWDSPKLWENPVRGVVVKCNDDIVAKVITGNRDYTEYTSMQYLEEQAPDIPAPRPHGLIAFGPFRVIFMSYVASMTLAQAWPSLVHEDKVSIQRQLDDIFRRLRTLPQEGNVLGGVCGEGVQEVRVDNCALFKGITTAAEFSDLQFSARHHGSASYVKLLRSFLEHDESMMSRSVFTHGDIRTANIMVKPDPDTGRYVVSGIIDWEYSGFYPAYYECTVLTRTLSLVDEDDWYLYLPDSVSPSRFPVRWLVDRLWGIHLRTT